MKKFLRLMFIFGAFFLFNTTNVFAAVDVETEAELKLALTNGEKEINLKDDIVLLDDVHSHATRAVGLNIQGEGVITINGNDHSITSSLTVAVEVRASAGKTLKVIFNDITIQGSERAVDTRSNNLTLELNKTNLSVTKSGNYQPLTIGGNAGRVTVNIKNGSVIDGGEAGYGIITFNPVDMNITESTVKGYAAIYMKESDNSEGSAGSIVNIEKSLIEGNSKYSGTSDNFGTIVFNDKDITMNIKDSIIKSVNTGTAYQVPFVNSESLTGVTENTKNIITVEGETEIIIDTQIDDESLVLNYDNSEMQVVVKSGVESNVEIPSEYLETGLETTIDNVTGLVVVVKRYNVTLNKAQNGIVTVKENALSNEVVEVLAKPNKNYKIKNIEVLDSFGQKVQVLDNKFTMPESDVTVTVTFASDIKNPETSDNILVDVIIACISLLSLGSAMLYLKRNN